MNFLDFSDTDSDALELVNLDHVRSISVQSFKEARVIALTFTDGSEDVITVSPGRWEVIEGTLYEWVAA